MQRRAAAERSADGSSGRATPRGGRRGNRVETHPTHRERSEHAVPMSVQRAQRYRDPTTRTQIGCWSIRPARCRRMTGRTAFVVRITPNRLTSKSDFACSRDDSSAPASSPTPALLTSRSMWPAFARTSLTAASTDASLVTSQTRYSRPVDFDCGVLRCVAKTRYPAPGAVPAVPPSPKSVAQRFRRNRRWPCGMGTSAGRGSAGFTKGICESKITWAD